jgi:ATP-dependent helicase/nuclease subunit A
MHGNLLSAIEPDRNAVVHAAAGTGKTWLLTSRIMRLLLNGAEPGSIVAITFTRKAAQEMTERIHQRLLRMAAASPARISELIVELGLTATPAVVDTARGLYERLLTSVYPLRSTTFHAFCQELLRRFPLESGVAPGFELIEDTGALRQEAWRVAGRRDGRAVRAVRQP